MAVAGQLLERDTELVVLADALAAARAGAGAVLVLEGAAGIGKTALLSAARTTAADMHLVTLCARGTELERDHAFGVVGQLVAPLRERGEDRHSELLPAPAGHGDSVLRQVQQSSPASDYAVFNGLYWLLADLAAEGPAGLFLDDAQWADEPSLRFLAFLAPRIAGLRLAVVVATRDGEQAAHSMLIDELRADPVTLNLRLAPLSHVGTARLLRRELGSLPEPGFARACRRVTDGNPFYLRALAGELRAAGVRPRDEDAAVVAELAPPAVAQAVRIRLSRLGRGVLDLARAAAVLGDAAQLRHAARLARIGAEQAAAAADEIARMGIFAGESDTLSFVHAIVRSSVYEDIGRRNRAAMHARAARLLADEDPASERVAAHLLLADAHTDPWVVETLRLAARRALESGAPQIAARLLARALEEPPAADKREDVLYELGIAEARARSPAALDRLQAAMATSSDPCRRAQIALLLANELGMCGEAERAMALLEAAIEGLGTGHRQLVLELESMLAAVARMSVTTHRRSRGRLAALGAQIDGDGPAERLVLANLAFQEAIEGTSAARACAFAERALGADRLLAEVGADGMAFYFAVNALCYADRYDLVDQHLQAASADARRSGSVLGFALTSTFGAWASYRRGLLVAAEADARSAIDAFGEADVALLSFARAILATTLVWRGQLGAAELVLEPIPSARDAEGIQYLVWAVQARADLRFAQGRMEDALDETNVCGRTALAWGLGSASFQHWRTTAAEIHLARDEPEQARALASEELALARAFGAPRAIGIALRTSGLVEGGTRGMALLREAESPLESCGARLEHARALTARGSALRRANRRADAREPLMQGLELAHRCGAQVLENHARTELAATGARPRRPVRSGVDALTPSEARVAAMAANGLSNRAIARALFVTEKTVETHLGRVYAKLGLSSRTALPRSLRAS